MTVEYEATFININKEKIREKLISAQAKLIEKELLQKRDVFNLPDSDANSWIRVRQEGNKITMSLKMFVGGRKGRDNIESQREICLNVDSYQNALDILKKIGCKWKSYQETKRETWKLDEAEITIDTWPFLDPFLEIEGESEMQVEGVCQKIGLNYKKALFCTATDLYAEKFGASFDKINNRTPRITFDMENPFLNHGKK